MLFYFTKASIRMCPEDPTAHLNPWVYTVHAVATIHSNKNSTNERLGYSVSTIDAKIKSIHSGCIQL